LKKLATALGVKEVQYSENRVADPYSDDFLIKADKNPNRAGVEALGMTPFRGGAKLKIVLALERINAEDVKRIVDDEPLLFVMLASNAGPATEVADVVLPSAVFAEQEGSFTNFQGRVQKFDKALQPNSDSQPAWHWIQEIARGLGHGWNLTGSEELLKEFFGMNYAELGAAGKIK